MGMSYHIVMTYPRKIKVQKQDNITEAPLGALIQCGDVIYNSTMSPGYHETASHWIVYGKPATKRLIQSVAPPKYQGHLIE